MRILVVLAYCVCVGNAFVHPPPPPPWLTSARQDKNLNISLLTMALKRDMSQLPSGGNPYDNSSRTIYDNWSSQRQQQPQINGYNRNAASSQNQNLVRRVSRDPRDYYYNNFAQQYQNRNGYRRIEPKSPLAKLGQEWLEKARELVSGSSGRQQQQQRYYYDDHEASYLKYDRLQQELDRKGFRRLSPSYQQEMEDTSYLKKDTSRLPKTFSDHPREYDSTFSYRRDDGMDSQHEQMEFRRIALGDLSLRQEGEWLPRSRDLKRDIANVRDAATRNPMSYGSSLSFQRGSNMPYQPDEQYNSRRITQSIENKWKRDSLKQDIARVIEQGRGGNGSSLYATDRLYAQQQQAGFRRLSSMDQPFAPGLKRDIAQVPDGSSGGSMFSLENVQRNNNFDRMSPYYERFPQNENWSDRVRSRNGGRPYDYDARYSMEPNSRMMSRQERRNELRRKSTRGKSGQDWLEKAKDFINDIARLKS